MRENLSLVMHRVDRPVVALFCLSLAIGAAVAYGWSC